MITRSINTLRVRLGYTPLSKGYCSAYTILGIQAFHTNNIEVFNNRIEKITQPIEMQEKKGDILDINDKAYFDSQEIIQLPQFYPHIINRPANQHNLTNIFELIESQAMQTQGGLKIIDAWPGIYTPAAIEELISKAEQASIKCMSPISLLFANNKHRFSLSFSPETNCWYIIDIANHPIQPIKNKKDLIFLIANNLDEKTSFIGFDLKVIASGNNYKKLEPIFSNIKEMYYESFPYEVLVNMVGSNGTNYLHLAAQNGYTDVIKNLKNYSDKKIFNMIEQTSGVTPLFLAAQNGFADTVRALIEAGAEVNQLLPDNNATALFIAAQCGNTECVEVLLKNGADYTISIKITLEDLTSFARQYQIMDQLHSYLEKYPFKNTELTSLSPYEIALLMGNAEVMDKISKYMSSNKSSNLFTSKKRQIDEDEAKQTTKKIQL